MSTDGMVMIQTDDRARVVLPGHRNERFLVEEQDDGIIRLIPATVISQADLEYLTAPELRDLLARAAASPTVSRGRRARRPE